MPRASGIMASFQSHRKGFLWDLRIGTAQEASIQLEDGLAPITRGLMSKNVQPKQHRSDSVGLEGRGWSSKKPCRGILQAPVFEGSEDRGWRTPSSNGTWSVRPFVSLRDQGKSRHLMKCRAKKELILRRGQILVAGHQRCWTWMIIAFGYNFEGQWA